MIDAVARLPERLWGRAQRRLDAAAWTRRPRVGVALIVASCAITWLVAFLGPSSVTIDPGPGSPLMPPWFIPASVGRPLGLPLPQEVVVPALWLGIALGAVGLAIALRAVDRGWRPHVRKLFGLGVLLDLATALVPPLTSADVLMYAAYGRLQRQGLDPYTISPAEVFRQAFDPVLVYTERPWQDTPSVYGPVASASQWLANVLGGDSMHHIVFWLQMMCVVPFVIVGAVVVKLAHDDPKRQARAVLFTVANPLLIWAVVAGAHNEALTLVFAIVALAFVRRSPFVTGLFIGLAGTVKVSLVFYGLALVWAYRRDWRKLLQLGMGALIPLVIGYGVIAPQALFAASRNTGYISQGSWGLPVVFVLELVMPGDLARSLVSKAGWVLMIAVGWMLSRVLPWDAVPGARVAARHDELTIAVRTAVVLCAAWVLTSSYSLAWYDLIVWVPLALLARTRLEALLIARGAALSIGYVSARALDWTPALAAASWVTREAISSTVSYGVLAAIVAWWWRAGHELPTLRRARGPAASAH